MRMIDSGWSTRHIHRQLVLSSTHRQKRQHDEANAAIDLNNKLLWCWPRRRLAAESIRDSVLVATGERDRSLGGVSIPPPREGQQLRRTIYLFQQRSAMPSVMEMFDAPSGIASCARRSVSSVALQPLFIKEMNRRHLRRLGPDSELEARISSDELGYVPVERPLTPSDMHATLLHALGIDQHRLSYNHNNRDEIPTVFGGEVIKEVFA